jgi:hypothetical protein
MKNPVRLRVHVCNCQQCQQHPYSRIADEHRAINRVLATLNEKNRRRFAGLLALQQGRGGVEAVIQTTGLSRNTICRGRDELQRNDRRPGVRQTGAGRPKAEKNIPGC